MNTSITIIIALGLLFQIGTASGQQSNSSQITPATFNQPTPMAGAEKVSFARQPMHVGDVIEQNIGLELKMTMTMRKANELVGKSLTTVRTNQKRILTTTEVDDGRIIALRVEYPLATRQESIVEGTEPNEPNVAAQVVQGKTYLCRRDSGEAGELLITDPAGNRPPTEETDIVSQQMQMVGRTNPLAQFLSGRTFSVGEKIELPAAIAAQVFNLGDKYGKVSRFTLTLKQVQKKDGVNCAIFQASVEAFANAATQMRLEVEGPLIVDVATCRAQQIALLGPIGMSETRGSYSTAYQVIGTGKLQMSVSSTYRDVRR